MEDPPLASLSLTHVHYNPYDRVSHLCAWLALVPHGLCVTYATLIWSTREAEVLLMFAGQMGCEALNWALKRYIREERPRQMNGKGYGMPSSHAQFVSFFAVSLSLFLLLRHRPTPSASHVPLSFIERFALSLLALGSAASVAMSRIYLNYHTPKQVIVGVVAGAVFAVVWFTFTSFLRGFGWIDWALDSQLGRYTRMRDLCVTEDIMQAGWEKWELTRRKRADAKKRRQ